MWFVGFPGRHESMLLIVVALLDHRAVRVSTRLARDSAPNQLAVMRAVNETAPVRFHRDDCHFSPGARLGEMEQFRRRSCFALKDKVALVTGGYGGIGQAISEGLASLGAKVAVRATTSRKPERAPRVSMAAVSRRMHVVLTWFQLPTSIEWWMTWPVTSGGSTFW